MCVRMHCFALSVKRFTRDDQRCIVASSMPVRHVKNFYKGYWHQRADERHGNPPQGNQELLVVSDSWKTPR